MPVLASPPLIQSKSDSGLTIEDEPESFYFVKTPAKIAPPQEHNWSIETQGKLVAVKCHINWTGMPKLQRRGQIAGFTRASRLRLLKAIARMDWELVGPSLFITLTYPDERSNRRMKQRTQDRSQFVREVERFFGRKVATIWRTEWKPRKSGKHKGKIASHIHLLLLGVDFIPWQTVRSWWKRILGWDGYVHTFLEQTWDGPGASLYVAKYCSKVEHSPSLVNAAYLNKVGRHWGITRKRSIPVHCPKRLFHLSDEQIHVLRAVAAGMLTSYDLRYDQSFTLLGDKAEKFAQLFWANGVDVDIALWYLEQINGGERPHTES